MVTLSKSLLNVRPQISPNIHVFHSGLKCSSYKHLFNSGPPSARQRCWRRRRPRRVEVVEKMWRSGGENEGSIDILDFEYFGYFFTQILFIYFSGEHRDDRDHRERRRSRSRERRRRSRSRSRERHRRQDYLIFFLEGWWCWPWGCFLTGVAGGGVGAGVDTGAITRGAGVEGSVGEREN